MALKEPNMKQIFTIMKQNRLLSKLAFMLLAMLFSANLMAQKAKTTDADLIGVWVMESMRFEGDKENRIGNNYNQVKVYRANGEYACAEVGRISDTETMIVPHEYGSYTYKNGKYTENGRKGTVILLDKTHFEGQWLNRHDKWRKASNMPATLVDYIVDKCKRKHDPKDIQTLSNKYILSTPNVPKKK